jgi:hypothetical protein
MEDLLRSKRMYRITLAKEQEHIDDENKVKYYNMNDELAQLGLISTTGTSNKALVV